MHTPSPAGAFQLHLARVTSTPWEEWRQEDALAGTSHERSADFLDRWRPFKSGRWLHLGHELLGGSCVRRFELERSVEETYAGPAPSMLVRTSWSSLSAATDAHNPRGCPDEYSRNRGKDAFYSNRVGRGESHGR